MRQLEQEYSEHAEGESDLKRIFWWKKEAREFANDCDMGGESCSLGGDECSMDLMVVQRRLGFFEASLMRSRLAACK